MGGTPDLDADQRIITHITFKFNLIVYGPPSLSLRHWVDHKPMHCTQFKSLRKTQDTHQWSACRLKLRLASAILKSKLQKLTHELVSIQERCIIHIINAASPDYELWDSIETNKIIKRNETQSYFRCQ